MVRELLDNNNVKHLVLKLAINFKRHGRSKKNVRQYQILDDMIKDAALSAAKAVARKKYGYMRNPELFLAGRALIMMKMILDCKRRSAPYTPALLRRADNMEIDLSKYDNLTATDMMKEVRSRRQDLWKAQKQCEEEGRVEWLREEAKKRAEAGDKETEKVFQDMCRVAESRAVNRKLTCILKPRSGAIDRIEIPTHDWFYSEQSNELYHYERGNFETHPHLANDRYYMHHTLKVPNNDIIQCQVEQCGDSIRLVEKYQWFCSSSKDMVYNRRGREAQSYRRSSSGLYCLRRDSVIPMDAMACTVEKFPHGQCRLVDTFPIPAQIWQEVTSPDEMEGILLERNKRHLQQLDAEGSCQDPVMADLLKDHGLSPAAKDLLAGRYATTHSVSPEMASWMSQMTQTTTEKESPIIAGYMTKSEYQECFKVANEKTSSSPAGLHYTIWKAMAAVDYLAEFLCIMISLPFMYGFVNNRWRNEVDVMLEKKKGVRKIHQLRIIGLLEADFNTALKYFFSCKMQSASETNGSLSDEQHGSRANRTCINAIMTKLLTFECARSKRTTLAENQHDMKGCFDRMQVSMSNIHASKQNVSDEMLQSRAATIDGLQRCVKTSLGVSKNTYHQVEGEHKIHGEVQGKGDVPSLFCQQSSALLKAHEILAPGVVLNSCTGRRAIRHNNVCYVDDNDGQTTADHTSEHPVQEVLGKLQTSVDVWNRLVHLSGHALAPHKECWTLLAFEWLEGKMKLVNAVDDTIVVLEDGKGVFSVITFMPPHEPNGGLGVKCCPDGKQRHHLKAIKSKLSSLCGSVSSAFLTEKEAYQALIQRIIPMLSYQLHATSLSESECGGINTLIRRAFLPKMKINRHLPNAVTFAPIEYGGMEFPEAYTLQDQLQIPYFIQCLRMNDKLANDFLTTLDNIQLDSGCVSPIMEDITLPIDYIDTGWIISLRERMREMDAGIWIEDAWTPKLQRENDTALMEVISQLYGITPLQLFKVNEVCKYLRVITIADLVSEDGTQINANMMNGEWTAGTDLEWPRQEAPPKSWFALFRKCIREVYSTRLPSGLRPTSPMLLDTPLGSWLPVVRNTWWTTYRSHEAIFYRDEEGKVEEFRPSGHGFFSFYGKVDSPPIDSHPISVQQVGDRFWTHKTATLLPTEEPTRPLPGHIINDTFDRYNQSTVKCGSDGSLHLRQQVAAAAWLLSHGGSEHVSACFLLTDVASVSIYRAELEGVFRTLKHIEYLDMSPHEVEQWCDNEQSVIRSMTAPTRLRQMIEPEADLVLAIHALKTKLEHEVAVRHVHGHQDGQGKKKAEKARVDYQKILEEWEQLSDDDSDASTAEAQVKYLFTPKPPRPIAPFSESDPSTQALEVQINTECDRIASQTTAAMLGDGETPTQPILSLPYEGSKAMLKIGRRWVTKNYKREIYRARRTKNIKAYCKERYGWSEDTFHLVHWDSIGTVRAQMSLPGKRQTMKLMHGWLPVMHMRQFISGINHCPGCHCEDETLDHIFQCPHHEMKKLRPQLLKKLMKAGRSKRIPRNIMEAICHILRSFSDNKRVEVRDTYSPEVHEAFRQQGLIGFDLLSRGYIARGWMTALESAGLSTPDRQINSLQKILWEDWALPIWAMRNSILHGPDSKYLAAEDSSLSERILWFMANKEQVLARGDQFMANIDVTRLHRMRRETKKAWIKHLDKLREAFRVENATRAAGQRPITQFLIRVHDGIS